jgi:hypothetical protein
VFDLDTRATKVTASDPDGDPFTMMWVATTAPSGVSYLYSNQAAANPVITAQGNTHVVGDHDFSFTATDPFSASASDTLRLTGLNRAPVASVAAVINPAPLVVTQTCYQYDPIGPETPAHCVAAFGGAAPSSTYTLTVADPDGDPFTVVATPDVNNGNAVVISGHSQSGASISVSSATGTALALSATIALSPRTFADPCTGFNISGYFVGYAGKIPGPSTVGVTAVASDPFTSFVDDTNTTVSASNKVNCP